MVVVVIRQAIARMSAGFGADHSHEPLVKRAPDSIFIM